MEGGCLTFYAEYGKRKTFRALITNGGVRYTANGAACSAILYSIVATAQANGLNTEQYLTELFSQPAGTIIMPFK